MVYAVTVFRFFRRLLVCSVVGVTVFGVSGWHLRPKPDWVKKLVGDGSWAFVDSDRDLSDQTPIWLYRTEAGFPDQVVAISPSDGDVNK